MTLRLNGATSGYTEIDAPATAGNNTLTLPTSNGSAGNILGTDGAGNLSWVNGRMVLATSQASTSGTFVDFTGIPSWVKRITVIFSGVSTSGASVILVQLGAGSVTTSGYLGTASNIVATVGSTSYTTGCGLLQNQAATNIFRGMCLIGNITGSTWVMSGQGALSDIALTSIFSSNVTLTGTLDRVRITTVNGTDTFDAGSINILYEG